MPESQSPDSMTYEQRRAKKKFLKEKIEHHINDFRKKRGINRFGALGIRGVIILAGAFTTIILGLKSNISPPLLQEHVQDVALVLSTLVTAISAWEAFVDYHTKWIAYRSALYEFLCIKDDFEYDENDPAFPNCEEARKYYNRMEAVVRDANEKWLSSRSRTNIPAPNQFGSKPQG